DLGKDDAGSITLSHRATCATAFVVEYLNDATSDPRIGYIFDTSTEGPTAGEYRGIDQGVDANDAETQRPEVLSHLNLTVGQGVVQGPAAGVFIMTKAEQKFNMAILAEEGFNVGASAEQFFNEGIAASFEYLGATEQ